MLENFHSLDHFIIYIDKSLVYKLRNHHIFVEKKVSKYNKLFLKTSIKFIQ